MRLVSHAVWADNLFLFATNIGMMQEMINDVDQAFGSVRNTTGERHFLWKRESLEYMLTGMPVAGDLHIRQAATVHEYKLKHKIVALGECLDAEGSTTASVEFNFGRGETHYFWSQGVLANETLPVPIRLRAWRDTAATAATHGSETWHIAAGILAEAHTCCEKR